MVGRRDQANRATVPPAQLAILPRLEAKTRPARSETMAVVRSSQVESHLGRTRLTSKAPYKACSGFTRVTARWIAQPPKAAFVTRLQPGSSPVSCPTKPLVSYRSNRQLSGWNPPPLVIRAVGAH